MSIKVVKSWYKNTDFPVLLNLSKLSQQRPRQYNEWHFIQKKNCQTGRHSEAMIISSLKILPWPQCAFLLALYCVTFRIFHNQYSLLQLPEKIEIFKSCLHEYLQRIITMSKMLPGEKSILTISVGTEILWCLWLVIVHMTKMVTKMSTSQLLISKLLGIAYSDLSSRRNNNYTLFFQWYFTVFKILSLVVV